MITYRERLPGLQSVLITGATGGIGRGVLKRLLKEKIKGLRIGITDRDPAALRRLVRRAKEKNRVKVEAFTADLSDVDQVAALGNWALETFGRIGMLINIAGFAHKQTPDLAPLAEYEQHMRVNCFAPLQLCQILVPKMAKRRAGYVFNVTSSHAHLARPESAAYSASKAALAAWTRSWAAFYAGKRVYFYSIQPGLVATPDYVRNEREAVKATAALLPIRRVPGPDSIALAILRQLGEGAEDGILHDVVVDGGRSKMIIAPQPKSAHLSSQKGSKSRRG